MAARMHKVLQKGRQGCNRLLMLWAARNNFGYILQRPCLHYDWFFLFRFNSLSQLQAPFGFNLIIHIPADEGIFTSEENPVFLLPTVQGVLSGCYFCGEGVYNTSRRSIVGYRLGDSRTVSFPTFPFRQFGPWRECSSYPIEQSFRVFNDHDNVRPELLCQVRRSSSTETTYKNITGCLNSWSKFTPREIKRLFEKGLSTHKLLTYCGRGNTTFSLVSTCCVSLVPLKIAERSKQYLPPHHGVGMLGRGQIFVQISFGHGLSGSASWLKPAISATRAQRRRW